MFSYLIFALGVPFALVRLSDNGARKDQLVAYVNLIAMTLLFTGLMWVKTGYYILFFFTSSLYFICSYIIVNDKRHVISAILDTFSTIKENFGLYLGVNLVFLFVSLVFLLMSFSPLWLYLTWFTGFMFEESETNTLQYYLFTFLVFLFALYALFILYAANVYLYETLKEIKDGHKIKALIKKLAPNRR